MSTREKPGRFHHPDDPFARGGRPLDDRRQALDHCFAKLLKLADGMHLPTAVAEARRRHQALLAFLAEYERELE
jgi:HD superfamily phosphodiesterase